MKSIFDPLIAKLQTKVCSWMGSLLSLAGKVTLIQSVPHSMTMYQVAILDTPVSIIENIEVAFQFFLGLYRREKESALDLLGPPVVGRRQRVV